MSGEDIVSVQWRIVIVHVQMTSNMVRGLLFVIVYFSTRALGYGF